MGESLLKTTATTAIKIDEAAALALWFSELQARTNYTYIPLLLCEARYLVLKGGGGSGKSIFAGQKLIERATSEAGHRFLICRKVARTLRESCFKQIVGQILDNYPDSGYKINKSDMRITFKNGSEIIFTGLDDVEKLKSIYNITGIWIEEASEISREDFNQLDIRLRGETKYYKQIILTFNPVSIKHWLKLRFFDERDARCETHETTYRDNRFLDGEAIATLLSFKDSDEYYYNVYCLGLWGTTGKSIFDSKAINRRLQEEIKPVSRGYFEYTDNGRELLDISFCADKNGGITIYKEPVQGVPYVIGADTAGNGSDSFVAQVLDNRTGEQVCTLRQTFDEDKFAHELYCLGRFYNDALIGIETNFSTYPVMELERLRYPKQYVRESLDDFTHKTKSSFGFLTNTKTRPVIISQLIRAVRDDITILNDSVTMEEMLTFVRGEDFKPQAEAGAHDDTVMALAIAHYIRPQQSYEAAGAHMRRVKWRVDQWEDYNNATAREREMLIEKWGPPSR